MRKKSVVFFTQLIKTDISVQLFSRFNNLHRTTTSYNLRQLQISSLIYSKHKDYYFQNCIYEAMWLSNHTGQWKLKCWVYLHALILSPIHANETAPFN